MLWKHLELQSTRDVGIHDGRLSTTRFVRARERVIAGTIISENESPTSETSPTSVSNNISRGFPQNL